MQEVAGSSPVFSIWKPRNLQEKHCFSFDLRGFLRFDAVLSGVLLGFDFQFDGSHGIDRMYGIGMIHGLMGRIGCVESLFIFPLHPMTPMAFLFLPGDSSFAVIIAVVQSSLGHSFA